MTLPIAETGCCAGHRCDSCKVCAKGRCCRRDNENYRLPELGSWSPVFGTLGKRNDDGQRLECHACGGWYANLAQHAWRSHDLLADEYRAAFGLGSKRGLFAAALRAKRSDTAKALVADGRIGFTKDTRPRHSKEQAAAWGERRSLEGKSAIAEAGRRATPARQAAWDGQWKPRFVTQCEVCRSDFEVVPSQVGHRKTCSDECSRALRFAVSSRMHKGRTPEGNARLSEAKRRYWAEVRAGEKPMPDCRRRAVRGA